MPLAECEIETSVRVAPADDTPLAPVTTAGIVEMLLKDHGRLNRLLRSETYQRELIPGLLGVAIVGLAVHGIAMTAILNAL